VSIRRWPQSRMAWGWLALLFCVSLLHFASYDIRHQPLFTDVSYYLYYAEQTAQGAVPYVDYFEIKTPLVIFAGLGLQQVGRALGVDPLHAVRVGYLLLAVGAAVVLGVICVRLSNNRPMAAWIGLLSYCGFNLLGQLPAIGNSPKMISMLCTGLAMLFVYRRSWFWAGLLAGIAGMDWQPSGGLTFLAVVLAGLCVPRRGRNLGQVLAGAVVATLPILGYFLLQGALSTFLQMTMAEAFTKAASEATTLGQRLKTIWQTIGLYCAGERWLVVMSLMGMLWFPVRMYLQRKGRARALLVGLAVYHYGLVVFSLVDFQARIDLFILLNSLAVFAAVLMADLYYLVLRFGGRLRRPVARVFHPAAALVTVGLLVGLARPSFLRTGWRIDTDVRGLLNVTLDEQRQVAERIVEVMAGGRLAMVRQQEVLYLGRMTNAMPFCSWNLGTFSHYRLEGENREQLDTLSRLLEPANVDGMVLSPNWLPYLHLTALGPWVLRDYRPLLVSSDEGDYYVVLWCRRSLPPLDVRGVRYLNPERFKEYMLGVSL